MGVLSLVTLDAEQSPFVKMHRGDSVQWHPWNSGTYDKFKASDKPGLMSISHELNGLSVAMGKESFQNEEIAKQINDEFFPILIDKNEHPQLAEFFALYVWNTKQISGWPLTVFVTPDLKPIDGGGYYPPTDSWGSQGLSSVVNSVADQWKNNREVLSIKADENLEELERYYGTDSEPSISFNPGLLDLAIENLGFQYDANYGGFSLAPKSVSFTYLRLIDRVHEKNGVLPDQVIEMKSKTLSALLGSSVRDYIGGGFFSAATEETWTIPDFRKSALVQADAIEYLSQYPEYEAVVEETAQSLVDEFQTPQGFYSEIIVPRIESSEKSVAYTWTFDEVSQILSSKELAAFVERFGVTAEGNVSEELDVTGVFKGRNILKQVSGGPQSASLGSAVQKLKSERQDQTPLLLEEVSSVITNLIVASALYQAGGGHRAEAERLLFQIWETYWDDDSKRLYSSTQNSIVSETEASSKGYALLASTLLDFGKTDEAKAVQSVLFDRFSTGGGLVVCGTVEKPILPARLNSFLETDAGSANAIVVENLRRLSELDSGGASSDTIKSMLSHLPEEVSYAPEQFPHLLLSALATVMD